MRCIFYINILFSIFQWKKHLIIKLCVLIFDSLIHGLGMIISSEKWYWTDLKIRIPNPIGSGLNIRRVYLYINLTWIYFKNAAIEIKERWWNKKLQSFVEQRPSLFVCQFDLNLFYYLPTEKGLEKKIWMGKSFS